jgi:pimeloyl-ACP methyl ester carboxylesterase
MKDHAADILAIIRNLDIDNVVLVGLSMVAQLIAGLGNLGGFRGLILISLAPLTPLCLPEDMREQQIHANDGETSAECYTSIN